MTDKGNEPLRIQGGAMSPFWWLMWLSVSLTGTQIQDKELSDNSHVSCYRATRTQSNEEVSYHSATDTSQIEDMVAWKSRRAQVMQIPALRICCGCNMRIHTDDINPVEERGVRSHSPS